MGARLLAGPGGAHEDIRPDERAWDVSQPVDLRRSRYEVRDALRDEWPLCTDRRGALKWPAWKKCGVVRCAPDVEVTLAQIGPDGLRARTSGICSCNSVHACMVDASKILAAYGVKVEKTLAAHGMARALHVTRNVKHRGKRGHDAKLMFDGVQDAQRWFASGREYQNFALRIGLRVLNEVTGQYVNRTISSLETTVSNKNGWHVHKHDVWLINDEVGREQEDAHAKLASMTFSVKRLVCVGQDAKRGYRGRPATEFAPACGFVGEPGTPRGQCPFCPGKLKTRSVTVNGLRWVRERWMRAVELKMGEDYVPLYDVGVVARPIYNGSYLTKMGLELTDAGFAKPGSPWALAYNWAYYGKRDALRLFLEYCAASKGHRKLTWGRGLRELYAVDEVTLEEEALEKERNGVDVSTQTIPGERWDRVNRVWLAQLRLREAAEKAGDAAAALVEVDVMENERRGVRCTVLSAMPAMAKTRPADHGTLELDFVAKGAHAPLPPVVQRCAGTS